MTHRLDLFRRFTSECEDHRDVVRREAPEHIFLATELPQIETACTDVLQASQTSLGHHFVEFDEGRLVAQEMSHHHDPVPKLGGLPDPLGVRHFERYRLLDKNALTRLSL